MRKERNAHEAEREDLERRWHPRLIPAPELGPLCTGQLGRDEPFHRWLAYRQAFAPEMVRRFLAETSGQRRDGLPLLDPFSGSGTFVIECARRGAASLGVDAVAALTYVTRARLAREAPRFPDVDGLRDWQEFAPRLTLPIHRAALILAEARRHGLDGRPLNNPPALRAALGAVLSEIREDLATPLPVAFDAYQGDARNLERVADGAIAGVLTSPPYLSRHDYIGVTRPMAQVLESWQAAPRDERAEQAPAHPRAPRQVWRHALHPAVGEACDALRAAGEAKLAGITRSYFDSLTQALIELRRVLAPGAPAWLVIGGARLKDVIIPSDLILAEEAARCGFVIEEIREARRLITAGRKLGGLADVSPRESIVILRAPG